MKHLSLLVGAALTGSLFLSACTSGPYAPKSDPESAETSGSPVVLLDKDLVRTLAVDKNPIASRNALNLLTLQVALRNRRNDETLQIQVQTLFRDSSGHVLYADVGSEPAWQTLTLSSNQSTYYTQTALTPDAVKYTVRIRYLAQQPRD